MAFGFDLESNLFQLHQDLSAQIYRHGAYQSFFVRDPKLRRIHKASVRDRVVHQALFRVLYYFFDQHFIHDSYSCRFKKGTHRGVNRLEFFARQISGNWRFSAYILQCDIRKFFDSVDQVQLLGMLGKIINDEKVLWLAKLVIGSFKTSPGNGFVRQSYRSGNFCGNHWGLSCIREKLPSGKSDRVLIGWDTLFYHTIVSCGQEPKGGFCENLTGVKSVAGIHLLI